MAEMTPGVTRLEPVVVRPMALVVLNPVLLVGVRPMLLVGVTPMLLVGVSPIELVGVIPPTFTGVSEPALTGVSCVKAGTNELKLGTSARSVGENDELPVETAGESGESDTACDT